ncbi:hypothetical protein T05_14426 [Trichinella murrelli]|uniref:Uncharacterized protein n=1 Tax=Trichinella murrelli TaxID=144512 RepID=A0A0V0T2W4_9BILA|nr:hypothetical protein T05_7191 [Trichinella murrelli]KRX33318.1 hypothetical protein T05_14426 [Trichinella murrelli]
MNNEEKEKRKHGSKLYTGKAIAVLELHAFETIVILSLVAMGTAAIFPYSLQKGNVYINIGNSLKPTILHHTVVYTEELHNKR